jgi:hypothetical protein
MADVGTDEKRVGDILMADMSKVETETPVTGSKLYKLQDSYRTVEFTGVLLSEVSTDTGKNPRWTEIELYRITEGQNTGKYVLNTMGRSVVYHVHESSCNSGVPVSIKEVAGDTEFEPCHKCNPETTERLAEIYAVAPIGAIMSVDLEEDRPKVDDVADPQELLRKLYSPKLNSISGPGQRLLAKAAYMDDGVTVRDQGIHQAIHRVERL